MPLGGGEGNRTPVQNASRLSELQPCLNYGGGEGDLQGRAGKLPFCSQQPLAVACDQVNFEIDLAARLQAVQRGVFERVGDEVDGEVGALDLVGGQAGAVDDDRALAGDEAGDFLRCPDFEQAVVAHRVKAQHLTDAIDMPGNQMTANNVR